jgi:hypothetical protein
MARSDAETVEYMRRAGTRIANLLGKGDIVAEAKAILAEAEEAGDPVGAKLARSLVDYASGLDAAAKAPENAALIALHKAGLVGTPELIKRLSASARGRPG